MRSFAAICLLGLLFQATAFDNEEWTNFKIKYGRQYENDVEEEMRKSIFYNKLAFVRDHNELYRKGAVTFNVTINQFADLTSEEFVKRMTGIKRLFPTKTQTNHHPTSNVKDAPDSIDWRDYGYVTPVKDQGQCGSTWNYPIAEALEGQNAATTGNLVSLSTDQLSYCTPGSTGCSGGTMDEGYAYLVTNGGLCCADSFHYTVGACKTTDECQCATCSGYVDVTSGDENAVKEATGTVGPLSTSIDASHASFQLYNSGVYYEPACSSVLLDHGVLIAGYGNEVGEDYWLVKNSWGTSWGEAGYIKMARNRDNNCGIATAAAYPIS